VWRERERNREKGWANHVIADAKTLITERVHAEASERERESVCVCVIRNCIHNGNPPQGGGVPVVPKWCPGVRAEVCRGI
jgi:hypothetical protein